MIEIIFYTKINVKDLENNLVSCVVTKKEIPQDKHGKGAKVALLLK
jgi:hypothetical protein